MMKNISAFAELLYIVSNFEKGRVKSSCFWNRKYVKSLESSLEIMGLLIDIISENNEVSQDEIHFLQIFIHKNNGVIFSSDGNINALWGDNNHFVFSRYDFEDIIELMNDIIFQIKNLLYNKNKNYKIKISYLLRAFHNLPRVFIFPGDDTIFNLDIKPITQEEAIQYAFSYLKNTRDGTKYSDDD